MAADLDALEKRATENIVINANVVLGLIAELRTAREDFNYLAQIVHPYTLCGLPIHPVAEKEFYDVIRRHTEIVLGEHGQETTA